MKSTEELIQLINDFFDKNDLLQSPVCISPGTVLVGDPQFYVKSLIGFIKSSKTCKMSKIYIDHLINFYKVCSTKGIEDELLLMAYNTYKVMNFLTMKEEECFDFLIAKGIFKHPDEISPLTLKPWREWYDKLIDTAILKGLAYAIDNKLSDEDYKYIKSGNSSYVDRFVKVVALEKFFKRFKTEEELIELLEKHN